MKFDMTTPCPMCPFRCDIKPFLRRDRAREISDALTRQQQTFACHKTTEFADDGESIPTADEQHCAGALIMLEAINKPNQLMRISERLGMYDRRKLAMKSPVFKSFSAFVAAKEPRRKAKR